MEIVGVHQLIFSPAGHTGRIAACMAGAWGASAGIDLMRADTDYAALSFGGDELCLVGVPSFGGRVPGVAVERLRQVRGSRTPAVAVVSYGNRAYEDTLLELQDTLTAVGFVVVAAVAAVAEHSICPQFAAGRPDERDREELRRFADRIKEQLESAARILPVEVPGNRPYRLYDGVPLKPSAGGACVRCGKCARECPVEAIPADAPDQTDKAKCISCMHCVTICPSRARQLNRVMLGLATMKLKKVCSSARSNELFLPG